MQRIIFTTDFSPASARTLRYSVAFARESGAVLVVAHALKPPSSLFGGSDEERRRLEREQRDRLESFAGAVEDGIEISTRVDWGPPGDVLARIANEERADVMVVAKRSRSTLERFFVGSVTEIVAAQSPCPVLIVPDRVDDRFDHSLLCPLDFSSNSRRALDVTIRLSRVFNRPMSVLYVADPEQDDQQIDKLRRQLEETASIHDVPKGTAIRVVKGKPAQTIVRVAEEIECDLVVLGRRGRSGGDYEGLGVVAKQVLKTETFPIMIVPPR